MTEQPRRRPQPEEHGVPDYADDTSTAFDEADRPRFEEPAPMPADSPQAMEEFGVTGAEARAGEPLADKLAREEPPVSPDDPWPDSGGELAGEVVTEQSEQQAGPDEEALGLAPEPEPGTGLPGDDRRAGPEQGISEVSEDDLR